jgi:hypothetical protein
VVREWLGLEVVAQIPTQREAISDHPHELPLAPQILEEHEELELEEDDRVHRRPATFCVERRNQLPHEREVERRLQAPVEVIFRHQVLQREIMG